MRKLLSIVLLVLIFQSVSWAQQQPQFTHYGFNGMQISPAYAGITNRPEVLSLFRYQWLGYDASFDGGGSPQTLLLSAHTPVRLLHGGLGVNLLRDKIANITFTVASVSYSYHIKVGETAKLGVGLQGEINNIKKGQYRPNDENDPNVPLNSSDTKYDIGAGVWYESENLYAGAGINNLLQAKYKFADAAGTDHSNHLNEQHIYVTAGYHYPLSNDLVLTPMALLKHDTETFSYDAGVRATYSEKYWGGVNYRHKEAVSALIGMSVFQDNALRVGYAFDFTAFNRSAKAPTSHEVMVSYRLPEPAVRLRPAIRTPRYFFAK